MWEYVGMGRTAEGLKKGIRRTERNPQGIRNELVYPRF